MISYILLGIFISFVTQVATFRYKMSHNRLIMKNPKIKETIINAVGKNTCEFLVEMVMLYDQHRPKFTISWAFNRPPYNRTHSTIAYLILAIWSTLMLFSIISLSWAIPLVIIFLMIEYYLYWKDTYHYTVTCDVYEKEFKELYDRTRPTLDLG